MMRSLIRPSVRIPTAVLLLLATTTVIVLLLTSREPVIETLDPSVATDGEIVTLSGRHFGEVRGTSHVTVAGRRITSSNYLEWDDESIVIRIPEFSESGLVEVHTSEGQSEGVLLRHADGLPQAHGDGPTAIEVHGVLQDEVTVGDRIVIRGANLGTHRGATEISFEGMDGSRVRPPATREYYPYWSPEEVHVLVPPEAADGPVRFERGDDSVDLGPLEVDRAGGTMTLGTERTTIVERGVRLYDTSGSDRRSVVGLWIPGAPERPVQPAPDVLSHNGPEPVPLDDSMLFFRWDEPEESSFSRGIRWNERYTRSSVTVDLSADGFRDGYDTDHPLYTRYTGSRQGLAVENEDVQGAAASGRAGDALGTVENIWNWMSGDFSWDREASDNPADVLEEFEGSAAGLTDLLVSMLRAEGVPARPVRGVLVTVEGDLPWYSWAEFYLDGFGWVPADIARTTGAGVSFFGEDAEDITREPELGELDNRVIEFRAGVPNTPSIWPSSERARNSGPYAAHGITTELLSAEVGDVEWRPVTLLAMTDR